MSNAVWKKHFETLPKPYQDVMKVSAYFKLHNVALRHKHRLAAAVAIFSIKSKFVSLSVFVAVRLTADEFEFSAILFPPKMTPSRGRRASNQTENMRQTQRIQTFFFIISIFFFPV